jgi:hypothetical protein
MYSKNFKVTSGRMALRLQDQFFSFSCLPQIPGTKKNWRPESLTKLGVGKSYQGASSSVNGGVDAPGNEGWQ